MIGERGPSQRSGVEIITIIVASVMGIFVLIAAVILIVIIRLCGCKSHLDKCKHSFRRVDETEPVDTKELALYDDLIDISTQQSLQDEIPVYETIITAKSSFENTVSTNQAAKLTTNTCQDRFLAIHRLHIPRWWCSSLRMRRPCSVPRIATICEQAV